MDKIQNNLKKKKQLIGVILIAVIVIISIIELEFITNEKKVITAESESGTSEESTTSTNSIKDKTACGIKIKFLYGDKYWEKYDLTNAVFKTQEEYEDAVCIYIDEIAKLLNKQDWFEQNNGKDTLYLKLVVEGNSYSANAKQGKEQYYDTMPMANARGLADYTPNAYLYTLTFNSAMFDHNIIPIVHQLTDLVIYNQDNSNQRAMFSTSLSNGLDEYVQNYLGMGIASCNHGLDIHNYVIEHEKIYENDPTINSNTNTRGLFRMGLTGASIGSSPLISGNFWVECSSSFVDYLVQTYGIENVMKMVDGYDDSIYYLFNQNGIEGLISDWQQFLANYPCKMTWDEMNAYIDRFKSTHGY